MPNLAPGDMSLLDLAPSRHPDLIASLGDDVDAVADAVMDTLLSEVPYFRTLEPDQLAEVRPIVLAGLGAVFALWNQGRLASPEELAPFRAHGALRAVEGRPLTVLSRAYRVAARVGFAWIVRVGAGKLDDRDIANLAQLILGFIDQVSDVVTDGYVEASEHLSAVPERARRELFEDLLAGRFTSAEALRGRAQVLGLTLPATFRVLVAARTERADPLPERAADLRTRLRGLGGRSLLLISRERVVMLTDLDDEALAQELRKARLRGAAITATSLADISGAYERAAKIVELLEHGGVPARTIVTEAEADLLLHLSGNGAVANDPYSPVLGAVLDARNQHLIDALRAFFDHGNAVSAAHALGIHPQTMRNRLRRVRQLTNRDPSVGWDRFLLELALRAGALRAG